MVLINVYIFLMGIPRVWGGRSNRHYLFFKETNGNFEENVLVRVEFSNGEQERN